MTLVKELIQAISTLLDSPLQRLLLKDKLESLAEELFRVFLDHPEQVEAFADVAHSLMLPEPHRLVDDSQRKGWSRRNVHLDWAAEERHWHWPPKDFEQYDELFSRQKGLRVLGQCWGMSKLTHPKKNGHVLLSGDTEGLRGSRVEWASDSRSRIRCHLGATFDEVHDFLEKEECALENQPGFSKLTVAGVIGTGGHGSGFRMGPLGSMVTAVTLASIEPPFDQMHRFERHHDPEFPLAVTHLGRLGPVVEIELEVENAFRIAEEREIRTLGSRENWRTELKELIEEVKTLQLRDSVHSAEIWIAPYPRKEELTVAVGIRRVTNDPLSSEERPAVLRSRVLQAVGSTIAALISSPALRPLVKAVLRAAVRAVKTQPAVVMTSREGLDFGAPNYNHMTAVEMAVDESRGADAVVEVLEELGRASREEERLYVFSPVGVRFVGRGPEGSLAPQADREGTVHIEVPTFANEALFHGSRILPRIQRLIRDKFEARPHWGQRVSLAPRELAPLWPEQTRIAMRNLVKRLDPNGVFANPLVDGVLEF